MATTTVADPLSIGEAISPKNEYEDRARDESDAQSPPCGVRHRLPSERRSITHHFTIGGYEGYLTVGLFPNGQPGELFLNISKEGSTLGGLTNAFAKAISIGLQYGVPLDLFCAKYSHTRFEPSGWTGNPEIGFATSIMDYIFRWLRLRFVNGRSRSDSREAELATSFSGPPAPDGPVRATLPTQANSHRHTADALRDLVDMGDAPTCNICGALCERSGACFQCSTCGQTTGCG
jgi:ribonucleoside-diphosphate reductase alpha chain